VEFERVEDVVLEQHIDQPGMLPGGIGMGRRESEGKVVARPDVETLSSGGG
jgi:hypothetical protein